MNPRVRTQLFWRDDIGSVLRAIDRANADLTAKLALPEIAIYRAGFAAALQAVATSFDVHLDTAAPGTSLDLLARSTVVNRERH